MSDGMTKLPGEIMLRHKQDDTYIHPLSFVEDTNNDFEEVHVLNSSEFKQLIILIFQNARAALLQNPGEEKEDHLVDGLKFKYKSYIEYLKELRL